MSTRLSALLAVTSLAATAALAHPSVPPVPVGDPIPGLTAQERALFFEGKALYEHEFTPAEGLGPLFNGTGSCVACHAGPVTGGSQFGTSENVHHITRESDGQTFLAFELGGPVRQIQTWNGRPGVPVGCEITPEKDPVSPGSYVSVRHTPPVFGFGLLDAVPDDELLAFAGPGKKKLPGVVGAANWGVELEGLGPLLAFYIDGTTRTQPQGAPRVGRFGWKAPTATLFQFTTEPFNIELGVSVPFFPRENTPDGSVIPPTCKLPNQPNDTASANSLKLFYFQAFLAAPPRGPITRDVEKGEHLFGKVGCDDCHRPTLTTARDYFVPWPDGTAHRVDALSGKEFQPYSDLLIHDMGAALADHRPQGMASGRFWRTTPLWGIRYKTNYLHDGSATTVEAAILAHAGESAASTQAYLRLSEHQREKLLSFLDSL